MQLVKRRLTDLWVVGRDLTLDDGDGEPITVWIQKLNSAESNDTARRCDAARARVLAGRADHDSDEWQAVAASVREYANGDTERIVDFLLSDERTRVGRVVELQIANEEDWSKDNYIQGLRDAWSDGMERRWLVNNDDKEAAQCKDELDRFVAQCAEQIDAQIEVIRGTWMHQSPGELETRMSLKLLEMDGNQAWGVELWACQIYFGTRDIDNKRERYFESREEVDTLSAPAYQALHEAYSSLEVEVTEGKASGAPTDSSPSSEEPNAAATVDSSGLVGATP